MNQDEFPATVGRPIAWAASRLLPHAGRHLPVDQAYDDYARWCEAGRQLPLKHGVFREHLKQLADAIAIQLHRDGTDLVLGDTTLRPGGGR